MVYDEICSTLEGFYESNAFQKERQYINIAANFDFLDNSNKCIYIDGLLDKNELEFMLNKFSSSKTLSYEILINKHDSNKDKKIYVYQYKSFFFQTIINKLQQG